MVTGFEYKMTLSFNNNLVITKAWQDFVESLQLVQGYGLPNSSLPSSIMRSRNSSICSRCQAAAAFHYINCSSSYENSRFLLLNSGAVFWDSRSNRLLPISRTAALGMNIFLSLVL